MESIENPAAAGHPEARLSPTHKDTRPFPAHRRKPRPMGDAAVRVHWKRQTRVRRSPRKARHTFFPCPGGRRLCDPRSSRARAVADTGKRIADFHPGVDGEVVRAPFGGLDEGAAEGLRSEFLGLAMRLFQGPLDRHGGAGACSSPRTTTTRPAGSAINPAIK